MMNRCVNRFPALKSAVKWNTINQHTMSSRLSSNIADPKVGFIGVGFMGSKMIENMLRDGHQVCAYDKSDTAVEALIAANGESSSLSKRSIEYIAENCSTIVTMLPNDKILEGIANQLMASSNGNSFTHISCSTISPMTARRLAEEHQSKGHTLVTSPVFARPDGLARREATWMVAGDSKGRELACTLLTSSGKIVDMGDDVGAANVVKLCGNFLIATSIESIGESMALAEKHGVDRKQVMDILSSSIFDCLIYKGYGSRVAKRDHRPGGFSLELGLKDVTLVSQAAREVNVPMPFLSVVQDRYVSAKARGRSDFDWSAIGMSIAEDAGIDVTADVARNRQDIDDGNTY